MMQTIFRNFLRPKEVRVTQTSGDDEGVEVIDNDADISSNANSTLKPSSFSGHEAMHSFDPEKAHYVIPQGYLSPAKMKPVSKAAASPTGEDDLMRLVHLAKHPSVHADDYPVRSNHARQQSTFHPVETTRNQPIPFKTTTAGVLEPQHPSPLPLNFQAPISRQYNPGEASAQELVRTSTTIPYSCELDLHPGDGEQSYHVSTNRPQDHTDTRKSKVGSSVGRPVSRLWPIWHLFTLHKASAPERLEQQTFHRSMNTTRRPPRVSAACKSVNNASVTSEKTLKVSNLSPNALTLRQRVSQDQTAAGPPEDPHTEESEKSLCRRLLASRNGIIILVLLSVLLLAIIVTAVAAIAARRQAEKSEGSLPITSIDPDSFIPRERRPSLMPSLSPTPENPSPTHQPTAAPPGILPRPETSKPTLSNRFESEMPTGVNSPSIQVTLSPTGNPATSDMPSQNPTIMASLAPTLSPASVFLNKELNVLGTNLAGPETGSKFGSSVALSADGQVLAVGMPFGTVGASSRAGLVQVYELRSSNEWVTRGPALTGLNENDQFGSALALSGDGSILVASAPHARTRSGSLRSFAYSASNRYELIGQELYGLASSDRFGTSLALSHDGLRMAIGAPYHNVGTASQNVVGQVRVYQFLPSGLWSPLGGPLVGSDNRDSFGWSVDLSPDGTFVCCGAPTNTGWGGYVRCYNFDGNVQNWRILPDIRNAMVPTRFDDNFGYALSVGGPRRVAIGSPGEDLGDQLNSGIVVVHEYDEATHSWSKVGSEIVPSILYNGGRFGSSVSLVDGILVVGSPGAEDGGNIAVLAFDGERWQNKDTIKNSVDDGLEFGFSVDLSGSSTVAVGIPTGVETGFGSVRTYVYI